jgi:hypothetical protein
MRWRPEGSYPWDSLAAILEQPEWSASVPFEDFMRARLAPLLRIALLLTGY